MEDNENYYRNLWGAICIGLGAVLLIEHILMWESLWVLDFIGHEWLGFILILVGIGLNLKLGRLSKEIKRFISWLF